MIPLCLDQGVGCIPWSPLARGVLAGNRTRDGGRNTTRSSTDPFTDYLYDQPTDFDVVDAVVEVAAARDVPAAQVALAWLLPKPGVTAPIVGSTKKKHLKDALAAESSPCRRTRSRTWRSPTWRTPCSATSKGPPGRSTRVAPQENRAREIRGWHAGRADGVRFPRPGRTRLRPSRRRGGRAGGGRLARDTDLRRARGAGPGPGRRPRRPRGRARGAGGHREPELRPLPHLVLRRQRLRPHPRPDQLPSHHRRDRLRRRALRGVGPPVRPRCGRRGGRHQGEPPVLPGRVRRRGVVRAGAGRCGTPVRGSPTRTPRARSTTRRAPRRGRRACS